MFVGQFETFDSLDARGLGGISTCRAQGNHGEAERQIGAGRIPKPGLECLMNSPTYDGPETRQDLVDAFAKEAQARSDCGSYAQAGCQALDCCWLFNRPVLRTFEAWALLCQGGDLGHFGPGEMQKEFEDRLLFDLSRQEGIVHVRVGSIAARKHLSNLKSGR